MMVISSDRGRFTSNIQFIQLTNMNWGGGTVLTYASELLVTLQYILLQFFTIHTH